MMLISGVHEAIANLWPSKKVQDYLGVHSRTLQRYVAEGQLDSVLIGRSRLFDPEKVKEFKKEVMARKEAMKPKFDLKKIGL